MSTGSTFEELFPNLPRIDREWEACKDRLMALTADERVAAMRAGELTYRELCHWSAARPHEVPVVCTGQGGPGEFEWLAMLEPSIAERDETAQRTGRERDRRVSVHTPAAHEPSR